MTAGMGRPSSLGIARAGLAESNVARSASDLASTLSPEKLFPGAGRSVRSRQACTRPAATGSADRAAQYSRRCDRTDPRASVVPFDLGMPPFNSR